MPEKTTQRLLYIDWMRGLACLLMFQTHCYDSWLSESARQSKFYMWSQLGGTLPAPLFLFLAGTSFALVTDRLRQRGVAANDIARATIRRGAEIYGLGLLFRLQEFLLGLPGAPWTDLLRVDVLNIIGISMMLMGAVCWLVGRTSGLTEADPALAAVRLRRANILWAALVSLGIALATPPLWTTWRPHWLPWFLESYLNGVHVFDRPQPWLFPMFPWSGFAFAGLAVGLVMHTGWARKREAAALAWVSTSGAGIAALGWWLDARPLQIYAVYDFWHSSANFFLIRAGLMMVILLVSYVWCRWGAGQWGFSPVAQLGKTSLLVYWVHIEFVYGRFSILPKRSMSIGAASLGLAGIFLAMLLLSIARTRLKGRGAEITLWFRRPARAE